MLTLNELILEISFFFLLKVVLSVIIDYLEENNYDSLIDRLIVGCLTPSS